MIRNSSRKGGVIITVALVLLVLLGFAALVVDLGYARLVHTQLQAAADAAALGGAARLDKSTFGMSAARTTAMEIASRNQAHNEPVVLNRNSSNNPAGDIVLGAWDGVSFTPSTDPAAVNAVRVVTRNSSLTPLFSRVRLGSDTLGASALAIAIQGTQTGAGKVPYYLPFGLPSCLFETPSPTPLKDMTFALNPATADNTGWAMVGGHPSASWLTDYLAQAGECMNEWHATGEVGKGCTSASTGAPLGLDNGEATTAIKMLIDIIENDGIPWDTKKWGALPPQNPGSNVNPSRYGNVLAGPIPVFDGGPGYCAGEGSWNHSAPITGFVWAMIYDARWKGSAAQKNIWLRLDVEHIYPAGEWWGGGGYGVTALGPAVVVR